MFKSKKVTALETKLAIAEANAILIKFGINCQATVLEAEIKKLENGEQADVEALKIVLKAINANDTLCDAMLEL